jgi:pilus assembly protein Flp/PilA
MRHLLLRFLRENSGATAIEYALIAAGIASVIIVAVNGVGTKLNTTFSNLNTQLRWHSRAPQALQVTANVVTRPPATAFLMLGPLAMGACGSNGGVKLRNP